MQYAHLHKKNCSSFYLSEFLLNSDKIDEYGEDDDDDDDDIDELRAKRIVNVDGKKKVSKAKSLDYQSSTLTTSIKTL